MFWGLNKISHRRPLAEGAVSTPEFFLARYRSFTTHKRGTWSSGRWPLSAQAPAALGGTRMLPVLWAKQGAWYPRPGAHSSLRRLPSETQPRVPISFLGIPWPSLFSSRLTTMSRFLCLIMLFAVVCRVGGLDRHPLIYEVVGKTKIKQRKESGSAGSVRSALWSQRWFRWGRLEV